jgi:molybdenum cofactor guanylyltransferase
MEQNPNKIMPCPEKQTEKQTWDASKVSLIILAGGKSLRMGTNKAHLDWHAMRFIDVLVEKGRQLGFGEIILSGSTELIFGCRNIPDQLPGRGPLGGMHSSLMASAFENAFVIPVDCPGISTQTINGLAAAHLIHDNEITLLKHGNRLEPLIGMYATKFHHKILPVIKRGGAPVFRALDQGHIDIYQMDENEAGILNLNTKEAYLAWVGKNENHRTNKNVAGD